jgi:hypothetical protein
MPTVPPEFDRDAWLNSLGVLEELRPRRLAIAHYGFVDDPLHHLRRARESLETWTRAARSGTFDEFADELRLAIERHDGDHARFDTTAPVRLLYRGITEEPAMAGGHA